MTFADWIRVTGLLLELAGIIVGATLLVRLSEQVNQRASWPRLMWRRFVVRLRRVFGRRKPTEERYRDQQSDRSEVTGFELRTPKGA